MQVDESRWVSRAIKNVDRYLHRGEDLKGDEPQYLGGVNLLNTIGVAMGLPASDPRYWTKLEMQRALKGNLVYFEGNARKAIDVIANQIISRCGGDEKNYVTVLPIELYLDGKLFEVPLFRVQRYSSDSQKYYIDDIGRYYTSVSDWYDNNKLPPCKMAYPYDLRLMVRPGYKYSRVLVDLTPSARDPADICRTVDKVFGIAGFTSTVALTCVSGGLATPFAIATASSSLWGAGRATQNITDRALHGQSINPLTNAESRLLWLKVTESVFSLSAKASTRRLLRQGTNASTSSREFVDFMNTSSIVIRGINKVETTRYMIENRHKFSTQDFYMHIILIAFWCKDVYKYKTADTLISELN